MAAANLREALTEMARQDPDFWKQLLQPPTQVEQEAKSSAPRDSNLAKGELQTHTLPVILPVQLLSTSKRLTSPKPHPLLLLSSSHSLGVEHA